MKFVKYIFGILFIVGGIGIIGTGNWVGGLLLLLIGIIILPPISETLKKSFTFWQNKTNRYISLILLFIACVSLQENITKGKKEELKESTFHFKTCTYSGIESTIIPDISPAEIYSVLEEKGFEIKKSYNKGFDVSGELTTKEVKYSFYLLGCSPNKIFSVEAYAWDYTGNNMEATEEFIKDIALFNYKNADQELVRKWMEENISVDTSTTVIGGVTFRYTKINNTKTLEIYINTK